MTWLQHHDSQGMVTRRMVAENCPSWRNILYAFWYGLDSKIFSRNLKKTFFKIQPNMLPFLFSISNENENIKWESKTVSEIWSWVSFQRLSYNSQWSSFRSFQESKSFYEYIVLLDCSNWTSGHKISNLCKFLLFWPCVRQFNLSVSITW